MTVQWIGIGMLLLGRFDWNAMQLKVDKDSVCGCGRRQGVAHWLVSLRLSSGPGQHLLGTAYDPGLSAG